jgi:hypothetical protein
MVATQATAHPSTITTATTYIPMTRKRCMTAVAFLQGQSENTSAWMRRGSTPTRRRPWTKAVNIGGGQHR